MIQLTEITNKTGPIAKIYTPDGVKPAANVHSASGRTVTLKVEEVCNYLDSLDSENSKAILLGISGLDRFELVVDSDPGKDPSKGVISRTTQFFSYANSDSVSLMLLDFDSSASDEERTQFLTDLDSLLTDCIISEKHGVGLAKWKRPSSSATIRIGGKTGNGLHVFLPVKNAKPELLEFIHKWAWLKGYGGARHKITKAAVVLPVSIIDPAVRGPERIIYSSQALASEGVEFERVARECIFEPGGILDCELALHLLAESTVDFKSKWNSHKLAVAAGEEVREARKLFLSERTADLIGRGVPSEKANEIAKLLSDRILLSSDFLYKSDGTPIRILDILLDRDNWIDVAGFCDPIKMNFGRNVAQIKGDDAGLILHSFSHGGIIYRIRFCFQDLFSWIGSCSDAELMKKYGRYVSQAVLSDIELDTLSKEVAKRLGVSITAARSDAKKNLKMVAETPEITTESEIGCDPDASHHDIMQSYLAGLDARTYGDGLFVWKDGATIWEKQSVNRVIDGLGSKFGHVGLCRTASSYKQIASLILQNPYINVPEWPHRYGIPCVDGFWAVLDDGVGKIEYNKELGCRWKLKIKPDFTMKTPLFDKIIANVENPVLFQQLFGLLLSGYLHRLQKVAVFFGEGGSGKGTTNDILSALLPNGKRTGVSLQDMNNPERLVPLVDSVVNIVPEIRKSGKPIDLTGLKMLTGDSLIAGRQLYVGMFHFRPVCCHVINMNDWPILSSSGSEIQRRLGETIVRFNRRVDDVVVGLADKVIAAELPGVLAWAIEGIRGYFESGLDSSRSLKLFEDWTKSYDPISAFVDEYCVLCRNREGFELRSDLWAAFQEFCKEAGFGLVPGKYEFFAGLLTKYKCSEGRANKGEGGRKKGGPTFKGIVLNEDGKRLLK
jgi:hypothetical protein